MTKLTQTIFAHNGDVLLAGIVSLLLVILFVLLLHIYAKWFLAHARRRRRRRRSVSPVVGGGPTRGLHHINIDPTFPTKGLDASAIASIPLFVYDDDSDVADQQKSGLECVICLTLFEDQELGRRLPECGHGFHVECIDMWLNSHSNCPICRRAAVGVVGGEGEGKVVVEIDSTSNIGVVNEESALEIHEVEVVNSSSENGNNDGGVESLSDSTSARLSSSSLSSLSSQVAAMGGSLKKMVSRNNICERSKIHPPSSVFQELEDRQGKPRGSQFYENYADEA